MIKHFGEMRTPEEELRERERERERACNKEKERDGEVGNLIFVGGVSWTAPCDASQHV